MDDMLMMNIIMTGDVTNFSWIDPQLFVLMGIVAGVFAAIWLFHFIVEKSKE